MFSNINIGKTVLQMVNLIQDLIGFILVLDTLRKKNKCMYILKENPFHITYSLINQGGTLLKAS